MLNSPSPWSTVLEDTLDESVENEIALEKIRLFFRNAMSAQIIFIAIAIALAYSLNGLDPPIWSLVWLAVVVAIAITRLRLAYRFSNLQVRPDEVRVWKKKAIIGAAIAGLAWSCGGIVLMVTGDESLRIFFALVMGGMGFASTATLSAIPSAFRFFCIPVISGIIITAIVDNHGVQDYLLAFVLTAMLFILLRSAKHFHDSLDKSVRMAIHMSLLAEERDQARQDISAASEALRESEARQRILLENDPAAILLISPDLKIVYANPSLNRLLGYNDTDIQSISFESLITYPDDIDPLEYATGLLEKPEHPELQVRHKNSELIHIGVHGVQLDDKNVLWSMTDITERKRYEAELDNYRKNLEQLVDERTEQLLEAKDEAEKLARVKGEFIANMTHELRTPLNGVLGFAELMQTAGEEKAAMYYRRIVDSGKLLLSIINDILDFSKLDAGKLQTDNISYILIDTIKTCTALIQKSADDKGLILKTEIDDSLPRTTVGDPYRVQQVLLNVLSNAVKFCHEGEITLNARMQNSELCIGVTDSGIGMSAEELTTLFDAFSQADSSTTRKYGGTGLGMTISQRLMENMGGRIEVSSTPDVGSHFEIILPYQQPEEDVPEVVATSRLDGDNQQWLEGLNVLIVEDNDINRLLLEEMLTLNGAKVTPANDGQEALDIIDQYGADTFNVVLMDIHMPGINGLDAAKKIREIDPDLPVIAQTAHDLTEEQLADQEVGIVAELKKPLSSELVIVTILRWARR